MASSRRPSSDEETVGSRRSDRAADAVWRRLCKGLSEPWLDDIRRLRTVEDDFDASLDIWTVALTAELKDAGHRDTAAIILAQLRQLAEEIEEERAVDV